MAIGGAIAKFLATVDFRVDRASLDAALKQIAVFGKTVAGVAVEAGEAVLAAAARFDALGDSAEQLRTPIDTLDELRYVAMQTGASAASLDAALASMVSRNPHIKDSAQALGMVADRMRGMSDQARELYARRMGIDPTLIPMLTGDISELRDEYAKLARISGVSNTQAAESSRALFAEIDRVKALVLVLGNSVAAVFIEQFHRSLETARRTFMENFGPIRDILSRVLDFISRMAKALSAFVGRVLQFIGAIARGWGNLNETQKQSIGLLADFLIAWKLLNKGFLATPLGLVIALLAGLFLIVEDFVTWMEGGKTAINWEPWEKDILAVLEALKPLWSALKKLWGLFLQYLAPTIEWVFFNLLIPALEMAVKAVIWLVKTVVSVIDWFKNLWATIKEVYSSIVDLFKGLWPIIKDVPIVAAVTAWADALWNIFSKTFDFLGALFSGDLGQILETGKALFFAWTDYVESVLNVLAEVIKTIFSLLWKYLEDNFPDFTAWAERTAQLVRDVLGEAIDWICRKFANLLDYLPEAARRMLGIGDSKGLAPHPDLDRASLAPSPGSMGARASANDVTLNQKTEINVTTTSDPAATGREVAAQQGRINENSVRYLESNVT